MPSQSFYVVRYTTYFIYFFHTIIITRFSVRSAWFVVGTRVVEFWCFSVRNLVHWNDNRAGIVSYLSCSKKKKLYARVKCFQQNILDNLNSSCFSSEIVSVDRYNLYLHKLSTYDKIILISSIYIHTLRSIDKCTHWYKYVIRHKHYVFGPHKTLISVWNTWIPCCCTFQTKRRQLQRYCHFRMIVE